MERVSLSRLLDSSMELFAIALHGDLYCEVLSIRNISLCAFPGDQHRGWPSGQAFVAAAFIITVLLLWALWGMGGWNRAGCTPVYNVAALIEGLIQLALVGTKMTWCFVFLSVGVLSQMQAIKCREHA